MPTDLNKILARLRIKDLNALSKLSESALKERGKITKKEMATIYSSLVMAGLRLANETASTPPLSADCAAVCNYEVVAKKAIAVAGQITRVHVKCTDGNRVLGGGYHILTPIEPTYSSQGIIDVKPDIIVLQNGPGLMEYISAQNNLRHYTALSWVVEIYFRNFASSSNLPAPEVWVYAIAAKAIEATSGVGYFDPYDPHAWDSD